MAEGQLFEPLDVAKVSPFIIENQELAGFLLIPLLLPSTALLLYVSYLAPRQGHI